MPPMLFSHPTANFKSKEQREREEILEMIAHFRIIDLKKMLRNCKQRTTGQKHELLERLQDWVKGQKRFSTPFLDQIRLTFTMCPTAGTAIAAQQDNTPFRRKSVETPAAEPEQPTTSSSSSKRWDKKGANGSQIIVDPGPGPIVLGPTRGELSRQRRLLKANGLSSGPPLPPILSAVSGGAKGGECCTPEESTALLKTDYIHNPFYTQRYFITKPQPFIGAPPGNTKTRKSFQSAIKIPFDWYQKIASKDDQYDVIFRIYKKNLQYEDYLPHEVKATVNGKELPPPSLVPASHAGVKPTPQGKPLVISKYLRPRTYEQSQNNFCDMIHITWYHSVEQQGQELKTSKPTPPMMYVVAVVRTHTNDEATYRIEKLKRPREIEVTEKLLHKKAGKQSNEIQTGAIKMSLLDPIMCMKINKPVRFDGCQHLDCFDASYYLAMNFKKPSWKCPICNSRFPFGTLRIDKWFQKLLIDAGPLTREIELNPDGTFNITSKDSEDEDSSDDDDVPQKSSKKQEPVTIELDDSTSSVTKSTPVVIPKQSMAPSNSIEIIDDDPVPVVEKSKSKKQDMDIICLSDSDDEPPPAKKRTVSPKPAKQLQPSKPIETTTIPPLPPATPQTKSQPKSTTPVVPKFQPKFTTWRPKVPDAQATLAKPTGGFNSPVQAAATAPVIAPRPSAGHHGWASNPFTDRQAPQSYKAMVDIKEPSKKHHKHPSSRKTDANSAEIVVNPIEAPNNLFEKGAAEQGWHKGATYNHSKPQEHSEIPSDTWRAKVRSTTPELDDDRRRDDRRRDDHRRDDHRRDRHRDPRGSHHHHRSRDSDREKYERSRYYNL